MLLTLFVSGVAASTPYIYCEEHWQSSNCLYSCSVSNSYTTCGSGMDYSKWCRCGSCEKAWSTAQSACYALYISNNFQWCHELEEDGCCDYANPTSCSNKDAYTASSMYEGDHGLMADSVHWGPDTAETSTASAATASKAGPTILVLSVVALLGAFGTGVWYHLKKRKLAEDLANLNTISGPSYASPREVEQQA